MLNLKSIAVGACLLLGACNIANAAPALVHLTIQAAGMGWGADGMYITFAGTDTSQGCSVTNQAVILKSDPAFKESVALILSAMSIGLTPEIWLNGCYNNRPLILAMGVAI